MIAMHRIAAACAALLLAGCSIVGGPKESPTIFAPESKAAAIDTAWPSVNWQLSTTRPTAARMLDSSRIAVSPVPGELQVYKGALWARTPTEMLEDGVLRTLEDSGKIPAVARQGSGIAADYRLVMDIRHFEADYDGAATPSAVVEVSVKLLHSQDQSVVGSRTFRHAQPASGTDVGLVADAFAQALAATSHDIAGWVLTSGQAHENRHPSH
ncbi:ABC-type transport auxiliary lipoprotein family protein [Thermomonas sp. HDW16]|uniref:ABC-type transport auxiliary lipoprotein family protein n=1 Tax=Thermomonas sp. HDW16 TaxID=2714945 RepID=UPI00140CAFF6|nr:ABC-type transport auxiliary lipoprotein family protein [Thermomonas sp. HDW16]QIL21500.1 ABC transporter [Thermomonas sp. HDW16]